MGIYSSPPGDHSFPDVKPTLLVCWWMTIFCFVIILLRLAGRFIRSEQLFAEDRYAGLAIIPLFLRMGCVHVILIFGTNNVNFGSTRPSEDNLHRRAIGSGIVLASRVLHAATLWMFKVTVLEYFKRINDAVSESFSEVAIKVIRGLLLLTFIAVVISDLAECQPFNHYWQVFPDPGGKCRQAFAQLLTMSVCNVVTDMLLVLLPIRMILQSRQPLKRKFQLSLLFSMSLSVVGVTIYRAHRVMVEHGDQKHRTQLASIEILFATAAANSLVLGSFVRDRGVKKNKYRNNSNADSMDQASMHRPRRPTAHRHWGSDEDLVRGLGLGVGVERSLQQTYSDREPLPVDAMTGPRSPAVQVHPVSELSGDHYYYNNSNNNNNNNNINNINNINNSETGSVAELDAWQFPGSRKSATTSAQSGHSGMSIISGQSDDDALLRGPLSPAGPHAVSPRRVSFYDTGDRFPSPRPVHEQPPPFPAYPASNRGYQRGSQAVLADLSGFLGPPTRHAIRSDGRPSNLETVPQAKESPPPSSSGSLLAKVQSHDEQHMGNMTLIDAGGLLK